MNLVNNVVTTWYGDSNYIHAEHIIMYLTVGSCYTPETNIIHAYQTSVQNLRNYPEWERLI